MRLHLLLFLSGVLQFNSVFSQTESLTTVDVKLTQASFRGTAFPFDIPFAITGDVPENCFRIKYSYKIKDTLNSLKNWMNLPKNNSFSTVWKKDGGKFSLFCPGMHPNVNYRFEFEIFRNAIVDDKVKAELKKKLTDLLIKFAKEFNELGFNDRDLNHLNADLNDIFNKQLNIECHGSEIRSKCSPDIKFVLNIRNTPLLKPEFEKFKTANEEILNAYNSLFKNEKHAEVLYNELKAMSASLIYDIDSVLSGKLKMNKLSAEYLKLPFSPSLSDYRTYTLLDGLAILRKVLVPIGNLAVFLKGERKIQNTDLVVVPGPDYQSLYVFDALLKHLASGVLKDTINKRETGRFSYLQNLDNSGNLRRFISAYSKLEENRKKLEGLIASFPDFTAEVVLADALSLETVSIPDVVTEKTPYISAEGGISYSTSFRTALSYTGANFYLSPVNKKTPLNTFKGWNKFKKMFCFNVAIGNFFGVRPSNSFSILGDDSKSDLLVGMGLRLGRVIKVNAHWLPYKTTNTNSLALKKELRTDFIISVGADVNLLKALGNVGKVLKLIE